MQLYLYRDVELLRFMNFSIHYYFELYILRFLLLISLKCLNMLLFFILWLFKLSCGPYFEIQRYLGVVYLQGAHK